MNEKLLVPIMNKYSINNDVVIEIGNKILNNNIIIKYNYIPKNLNDIDIRLNYSSEEFNWELDFSNQTNMAMLHLHSLETISYLLLAYECTQKKEYLEKSYELLFDWYRHSQRTDHFYLWYRHCVADRAIIISQLYLLKDRVEMTRQQDDIIYKLIFSHKSFLFDEKNFVMHNHGLLMDMGLISLSQATGDKAAFEYSLRRIKVNFANTFTDNMICVENSISYSVYNIEQFIKCQKHLLEPLEATIDNKFDEKMRLALNFLNTIKQPDNKFPHLGDGEQITLDYLKRIIIFDYYYSHPIFTENSEENYMKVYEKEGYVVVRGKNEYLFLTSGDLKKNHKHADDLSFILYYDEEIFVDPGIYSYDNDELRLYQTSASAHNTIVLNNENYDYINNDKEDTSIVYYKEFTEYYYIILKNNSYSYANILRHIFILKSDFTVVINDEIISRSKVLASQYFNVSPVLSNNLSIRMLDEKVYLNEKIVIQSEGDSFFEFYNGNNPYKTNALYSEKFHDLQPIIKLSINQYSNTPNLITMLSKSLDNSFEFSNNYSKLGILKLKTPTGTVELKKESIDMNLLVSNDSYVNINRSGSTIECETTADYYENQEYAWDIMKGKDKENQIWYQESNKFIYTFPSNGTYTIRCYVRNKDNKDEKKSFLNEQKIIV